MPRRIKQYEKGIHTGHTTIIRDSMHGKVVFALPLLSINYKHKNIGAKEGT